MKRAIALLLLVLPLSGCTHFIDLGFSKTPSVSMTRITAIADPDHAEVALYVAGKLFEATVGGINQAHAKKLISEARYTALVASQDSPAALTQRAIANAYTAVQAWRAGASREFFDQYYGKVSASFAELSRGIQ